MSTDRDVVPLHQQPGAGLGHDVARQERPQIQAFPAWDLVELMEHVPVGQAARLFSERLRWEATYAAGMLAPLKAWPALPTRSRRTYRAGPNHVRLARIVEFLQAGDRVLDVGIGYGYVTCVLLRTGLLQQYCGVDLADRFLDSARAGMAANGLRIPDVHLEVKSLFDLDAAWVARHRPDLVLILEVLEHVADPGKGLRTVAAAIEDRTSLVFTVPMSGRLESVWGHRSVFTAARVRALCEQARLNIHHVEPVHNTWMLVLASKSEERPKRLARLAHWRNEDSGDATDDRRFTFKTADPTKCDVARSGERGEGVSVEVSKEGARCAIAGDNHGGLGLALDAPRIVRFQMTLEDPDLVAGVRVVGLDAQGAVRGVWFWDTAAHPADGAKRTHMLQIGDGDKFVPVAPADPAAIARIEVILELKFDVTRAAFWLHRVAYVPDIAEPPPAAEA